MEYLASSQYGNKGTSLPFDGRRSVPSILEEDWDSLPATVIPSSDEEAQMAPENASDPHIGIWKPNKVPDEDWGPCDVVISKNEPDDLAPDEPHGIVAVPEDATPNAAGKLVPKNLLFLLPGEKPDADMREVGHWRPKKWKGEWPPPKKDFIKSHLPTNKLPVWQTDSDWIKARAVIFPNDIAPKKNEDDVTRGNWQTDTPLSNEIFADLLEPQEVVIQPTNAEQIGDAPNGVWGTKLDSEVDENGQFRPEDVLFYPSSKKPGDECEPRGQWYLVGPAPEFLVAPKQPIRSTSPNLPKKAEWSATTPTTPSSSNNVGKLKVPDLFGREEDIVSGPASKKTKSKDPLPSVIDDNWDNLPAVVIPAVDKEAKKAPEDATVPHLGTWKQKDNTDDTDWGPLDVVVSKSEPDDLAPDEPHGIVAVPEDATPNAAGKLVPKDLLFLPPGEKPDADMKEVGHWRPKKWKGEWPPPKKSHLPTKKLPQWQTDSDWFKGTAVVFPSDKAPEKNQDNVSRGIWKTDTPLPASLSPQELLIQPVDAELEDPNKRNGVWGTSVDSVPDESGQYKPKDVFFYPPTRKPGDECTPRGRWTLVGPAPESLLAPPEIPVRTVSPLMPSKDYKSPIQLGRAIWKGETSPHSSKRASTVGKLKVPFVFGQKRDSDAPDSPRPQGRRSRRISKLNTQNGPASPITPGLSAGGPSRRISKLNIRNSWANRSDGPASPRSPGRPSRRISKLNIQASWANRSNAPDSPRSPGLSTGGPSRRISKLNTQASWANRSGAPDGPSSPGFSAGSPARRISKLSTQTSWADRSGAPDGPPISWSKESDPVADELARSVASPRLSVGSFSHASSESSTAPTRASIVVEGPTQMPPKQSSTRKSVGRLKLPAAFSGK